MLKLYKLYILVRLKIEGEIKSTIKNCVQFRAATTFYSNSHAWISAYEYEQDGKWERNANVKYGIFNV